MNQRNLSLLPSWPSWSSWPLVLRPPCPRRSHLCPAALLPNLGLLARLFHRRALGYSNSSRTLPTLPNLSANQPAYFTSSTLLSAIYHPRPTRFILLIAIVSLAPTLSAPLPLSLLPLSHSP